MGSSKGSSSSTFTPPPEVVEAYKEALGYGRAAMGQQYAPYTGEITAPLTPTQESGIYNVNRAVGTAIPFFGRATELVDQLTKTPIAVSTPGQLSQASQLATGATGVIAPVASPQIAQATQMYGGMAGQTITPQQFSQAALQPYMSPYTQAVADATFRNLREQQMQEQTGLRGGAIRAGAFGGDRAGIAAANMARQQDLATAQAMSNIYNQGYTQATGLFGQQQAIDLASRQADAARQMQVAQQLAGIGTQQQGVDLAARQSDAARQLQAAQQLSAIGLQQQALDFQAQQANKTAQMQAAQQLASLGTGLQGSVLQGAQAQLAAGAQQQAVQQAINSGYYNQYLGAQAYPYQQAQFFANLATGVGGQMGGTTTGTPAQPSPAGSIFGALGALGSIFSASDKRVKENIKPIGKTNDGQTIYRYNFKGDPTTQIGLIAQEVEKKHPEAVRTFNGVKGVDYKEATDDSVRSMGGGVVPSSTRKDFAAGGPSLSDEEDPMIPYKAGVPSKVLQIPKLAKIGGSKPNFGGEPPKSPSGPSEKDFKGAAEGLGKAWNKFNTPDAKVSGFENLGKDFEDMLPASAFSAAFAARGGAIGGLRPRFADGEDVPETRDSVYIPDRDRADIIRPSFNPESDAAPVRLASLGDATRRIDAGIPSSEPIREPARDVNVGLVPSMARSNADLPPLFAGKETPEPSQMAVAAKQAADAEPETPEAKPVSVPSMARADANVPAVTPGLAAAKVPARQAVPLTSQERDDAIRTIIGEAANQPYEGKLGVAQVIRNRQLAGRYGKSVSDIVYAPKQFSVWNPGDPAGKMARGVSENSPLYKEIGDIVDQTWGGTAEDPTKGATHFANVATVMAQRGNLQPWLQGMIDSGKTIKIGAHTFGQADAGAYSPSKEGAPSTSGKTLGDIQASYKGPTGEETEGAKPVKVASAGESWPGFGVAGEGKRSVIESIMGKDLDPIQKRALFSFFAGMAASPSPWFGQQLGAGMQAASNVYNESLNKQAELDVQGQRIGIEKERVGLEERRVGIEEKAKGLEVLKFWQSRYIAEPTDKPGVFVYVDTTNPSVRLSEQEYNAQLMGIMKQYNLTPSEVSTGTIKPGLGTAAGAGAPSGGPSTGLVPPPARKEEGAEAAPTGGITPPSIPSITPTPTPTVPGAKVLPPEAAEPAPAAKPAAKSSEAAQPAIDTSKLTKAQQQEAKEYEGVAPNFHPILLDQQAESLRAQGRNARARNLPGAEGYFKDAEELAKKAAAVRGGEIEVEYTDGRPSQKIPSAVERNLALQRQKDFSVKNLESNMKWREEAGSTLETIPEVIQSLDNISAILQVYKPNLAGEQLTKLTQLADTLGIPLSDEARQDADKFYELMKENITLVYKKLEQIGGRILQVEVQGLGASMPSGTLTPESARKLTAQLKAAAEYTRQYNEDVVKNVPFGPDLGKFDRPAYISSWKKDNPISEYVKVYDREIGARGATPNDANRLKEGKVYILEDGQHGIFAKHPKINLPEGSPIKVRFQGIKKDPATGALVPVFIPEK